MSTVVTKKPTHSNPAQKRTLKDFPEWQAAQEKMMELRELLQKKEEQLRHLDGIRPITEKQSRVAGIVRGLLGQKESPQQPSPEDKENLLEDSEGLTFAIQQHDREMDTLRRQISEILYREDYGEEHKTRRARIAKGIIELATAIMDNKKYVYELYQAGAVIDPTEGHSLLVNVSCCPQIWSALRNLTDAPNRLRDFIRDNANLLD